MPHEPSLTNTPDDRRVNDEGSLRSRVLKKEDSRFFEPQELKEKSRPAMFAADWRPVVVEDIFSAKPVEEVQEELAVREHREMAIAAEKTHAKDMKVFKGVLWAIGGFVVLCSLVLAVVLLRGR